ncbi:hypothetical protein P152DRAFT_513667 [Eremomyces bilateralis CBS 781.70]|uniref:Nuclear membrane fusion protein Kar5 n=1 Tax=Eremomyces bilateralis CBS 781.70 TaxID=1392243 RepID=A0A6G1G6D3_9PEZI|nr:uncharacterized protein P152DRAFT_513667 [Eremomyces bilateralis CBS 781.70]KAF1813440.1 hypothetical protein P152DRAFT_513667 [Eremomyces bilateralis CBS 781.70]
MKPSWAFQLILESMVCQLVWGTGEGMVNQQDQDVIPIDTASRDMVLSKASAILKELTAMSSCHREATKALYHSCSALGSDEKSTISSTNNSPTPNGPKFRPVSVDGFHNTYALRLGLCEIQSAGVRLPKQCEPVADPRPCRKTGIVSLWSYDCDRGEVEFARLEHEMRCRQALMDSSAHWTSYSNNRQNAVALCYSARASIEHEETARLFKDMVEDAQQVQERLGISVKTLRDLNEQTMRTNDYIMTGLRQIRNGVLSFSASLETIKATVMQSIMSILQEMHQEAESAASNVRENAQEMDQFQRRASNQLELVAWQMEKRIAEDAEYAALVKESQHQIVALANSLSGLEVRAREMQILMETGHAAMANMTQEAIEARAELSEIRTLSLELHDHFESFLQVAEYLSQFPTWLSYIFLIFLASMAFISCCIMVIFLGNKFPTLRAAIVISVLFTTLSGLTYVMVCAGHAGFNLYTLITLTFACLHIPLTIAGLMTYFWNENEDSEEEHHDDRV